MRGNPNNQRDPNTHNQPKNIQSSDPVDPENYLENLPKNPRDAKNQHNQPKNNFETDPDAPKDYNDHQDPN